jgi:hypothetical protein
MVREGIKLGTTILRFVVNSVSNRVVFSTRGKDVMQCGTHIVSEWILRDFAYLIVLDARLLKILIYCGKDIHTIDTLYRAMNCFI